MATNKCHWNALFETWSLKLYYIVLYSNQTESILYPESSGYLASGWSSFRLRGPAANKRAWKLYCKGSESLRLTPVIILNSLSILYMCMLPFFSSSADWMKDIELKIELAVSYFVFRLYAMKPMNFQERVWTRWRRLGSWDLSCLKNLGAWGRVTCVLLWLWKQSPDMAARVPQWFMVSVLIKQLILLANRIKGMVCKTLHALWLVENH